MITVFNKKLKMIINRKFNNLLGGFSITGYEAPIIMLPDVKP